MGRPRTDARRRVLEVAERLLTERGYHGFSYGHIARELGVKAPAIHYHFRRKEDLVVAVLARYRKGFGRFADANAGLDGPGRIAAYLAVSRELVEDGRVGALAVCGATFGALPEPVEAEAVGLMDDIEAWLAGPTGDREPARALAAAVLGAQLLGRVRGLDAYDAATARIRTWCQTCS